VNAFWTAVVLMALGFVGILALVFVSAVIAFWLEDRRERRYVRSPIEAAWEEHCRTTPGLSRWSSVSPAEMQPFEEALRQVPVIDFEGEL
jgi:hypothetical protein